MKKLYWSKLHILKSIKLLYLLIAILLFRLSLSGIYNYFNPAVVEMYDKELNSPLHQLINDDDNIIKVPKDIISEVFEKISKSKDMNEALYYIQIEKAKLCKNNERRGDRYDILSIIEKV